MSFLNPVNEPVLRFSSTDADAPQINYAARTAGDIKAVLKACLVTGYGSTASAGWTAVNEAGNVIEFSNTSTEMFDYRLGVDDTSTSSTTWYYQYKNTRTNPKNNIISKGYTYSDKAHSENRWDLIVSDRGFYFIETLYNNVINQLMSRLTFMGQIKSALVDILSENMSFWSVGLSSQNNVPARFYAKGTSADFYQKIGGNATGFSFTSVNKGLFNEEKLPADNVAVDLVGELYVGREGGVMGSYAGLLISTFRNRDDMYGTKTTHFNGRPVLYFCNGISWGTADNTFRFLVGVMIYLDYWEY